MDLMTLNANNQAEKLIENYDSLIWTERFNTMDDIQIQTGNVDQFLSLLPEGTRLTLRESTHAMVVETHEIERKKNAPQNLILRGRSFAKILEDRIAIQSVGSLTGSTNWDVSTLRTPSDLAWYIINQICVVGSVSAADIFPGAMVQFPAPTGYNASSGPLKTQTVERGDLLSVVLKLLQSEFPEDISTTPDTPAVEQYGIRAVRPNAAGTAIGIEIYKGVDRSATVYFDATRDLLDDGKYLFSKVGSKNVAYGLGGGMAATMFEGVSEPTGLERKVMLVDASQSGIVNPEILKHEMSNALAEAHETALFDGSINQDLSPYIYGVDYNLGDIVKVVGDYGLTTNARVTEYIRSDGPTGYKAFPTLTALQTA